MRELPSDIDTVIIGAGPSGLACAIHCQKNKKPFLSLIQGHGIYVYIYIYRYKCILYLGRRNGRRDPKLLTIH